MLNIRRSQVRELKSADLVGDASHNLDRIYTDLAGSEALVRALVAERAEDPEGARFWVEVYLKCSAASAS